MNNDSIETIDVHKETVRVFCEARDWDQFHGPKDLAIGLVTEGGELLDHFRFKTDQQCLAKLRETKSRRAIEDELADVYFFVLRFAQRFEIDLTAALDSKLKANELKYPIDKARGSNKKYDET